MSGITIKCDECGKYFNGKDECEAEIKWSAHECTVSYEDLSLEELRKLVCGEKA